MTGTVDDPGRLRALRQSALLDSPPEEAFDRLTRIAARLTRAAITRVTLIDERRQFFKSEARVPDVPAERPRETALSHSYCHHVVALDRPLRVPDAREHELLAGNPAIEAHRAIAYLGVPLRDAEGHVLGTLCAIEHAPREWSDEDVGTLVELAETVSTELALRSTARRLRAEQEELARSNRDLEGFASAVSHDLGAPLRTIHGFGQLIERRHGADMDAEALEFLGLMIGAAARGGELVDDLLTLARAGSGRLDRRPVDSAALAAEVLDALAAEDAAAAVRIGDLPEVSADRTQLRQVLQNLIGNALKFHGDAPPSVSVDAAPEPDGWRFTVADDGVGIDPGDQERIFEPLERGAAGAEVPGTGIGLTLCRTAVERHGGRIWVDSAPGSGTAVHFTIPG